MSAPLLPRGIRWLISSVAPTDNRDYLLDDLGEEYAARRERRGSVRALGWLLSQTMRSLGPLAVTRLRARRAALAQTPQGDPVFTQLRDDLRYSLRVGVRRPWLSLTIVATMVLGIGTTTAVFSMIDAVLLRPLAFPAPEQLVRLSSTLKNAAYPAMVVNHADISDLERDTRAFASIALFDATGVINETAVEPERISAVLAGQGFGETLQLRPVLGRLFSPDEYLAAGPSAVILTHAYWVSHFNRDNGVLGRTLVLSGRPRTIVGVLPPIESQYPPGTFDVWMPLVIPPDSYLRGRASLQLSGIARLRDGVTIERASAELVTISRRLIAEHPETNTDRILQATPLRDTIVGPVRPMLILLGTAVAAVLIIACANLGSLLLAHSQSRVREFAVRAAIGGAGRRIARQLLVESLMLAFVGGAAGIWFARFLVKGLIAVYPTRLPRAEEITLDWRVMLVALGATLAAGVLAGLPLARQVARLDLARDLREGERGLGSRAQRRLLDGMVVGQIATSVALLFAAAVLLRTFFGMTSIRPGFDATNVFTFSVAPSPVKYATPERQSALYNALLDSVRAIPGVRSVGWAMFPPFSPGGWGDSFIRQGTADAAPNLPFLQLKMVTPDYASTLRIPMLAGRAFTRTDQTGAPNVGIVNAALAAKYYPGTSPVGKHITFEERSVEIVGVLDDVRGQSLWNPATPELYVPIEQWGWRGGTIVVRTSADPRGIEPSIRAAVRTLDPTMPVLNVATLEDRMRRTTAPERFRAILVGTLAALALLLSLLGVYGLVAWVVGRRTREIGIRMALGEASTRVRLRVIGNAIRLGVIGVSLGAMLALGLARWLQAFAAGEISARDPISLLTTMAVFLVATAVAAWIPARRASRIDPLLAIRTE
jgi:putative ABC transport system permease protein